MENIIRITEEGISESQFKQIDGCFEKNLPWIIIRDQASEDEPEKTNVEVHFSIIDGSRHELIPMSRIIEQKIYDELSTLGPSSATGYPKDKNAPLENMFWYSTKSEAETIAAQAKAIIAKYFSN